MLRGLYRTLNPSPKTSFAKGENLRVKGRRPFSCCEIARGCLPRAWRARRVANPRHERSLHYVRPFVNLPIIRLIRTYIAQSSSSSRLARSAAWASWVSRAKNAGDWPMNSPILVKKLTTPMATPRVWVGRMMEQIGRFRFKNGHGSGMIRLF